MLITILLFLAGCANVSKVKDFLGDAGGKEKVTETGGTGVGMSFIKGTALSDIDELNDFVVGVKLINNGGYDASITVCVRDGLDDEYGGIEESGECDGVSLDGAEQVDKRLAVMEEGGELYFGPYMYNDFVGIDKSKINGKLEVEANYDYRTDAVGNICLTSDQESRRCELEESVTDFGVANRHAPVRIRKVDKEVLLLDTKESGRIKIKLVVHLEDAGGRFSAYTDSGKLQLNEDDRRLNSFDIWIEGTGASFDCEVLSEQEGIRIAKRYGDFILDNKGELVLGCESDEIILDQISGVRYPLEISMEYPYKLKIWREIFIRDKDFI